MNVFKNTGLMLTLALIGCWVLFAINFIVRTSHVSIDGVRYFTVFDDGMIGMRYAKNLVEHHALVWNVGDRVEGFTDPLWTLVMAAAIWMFGTHYAPLCVQIFGGIISAAVFGVYYRNSVRNKSSLLALMTGLLLLMFSYVLSYWGLSGMEACAICLAFAVTVGAQYSYEKGNAQNPLILLSCLIAIAYFLRPDGWLVIVPFFAACWVDAVRRKEYRKSVLSIAIPCVMVASLQAARVAYYGEWVPNTYILKVQGYSLALRLSNGMAYVKPFLRENLGLLGLIALAGLSKRRVALLNIAGACVAIAYQVYVGGDPWPFWRQLLPVYVSAAFAVLILFDSLDAVAKSGEEVKRVSFKDRAVLAVLVIAPAAFGEYEVHHSAEFWLREILQIAYLVGAFVCVGYLYYASRSSMVAAERKAQWKTAAYALAVCVCAYAVVLGNDRFLSDFRDKPFLFSSEAKMIDKAVLAMKLFGAGKTHHVVLAGAYPYYVEGKMIDSLGKSDKVIARLPVDEAVSWDGMRGVPGHAKYDFRESILMRKPDVIPDRVAWGRQDVSPEMVDSYVYIRSDNVSLCVKKELIVGLKSLVVGNCPSRLP